MGVGVGMGAGVGVGVGSTGSLQNCDERRFAVSLPEDPTASVVDHSKYVHT